MAWHKRGQSEDVFWFALFYLPLTAIVVLSLVIMPKTLMEHSTQPIPLDEQIQSRQISSRMWQTSEVTGRTSPFDYNEDITDLNKTYTKKQMAYAVTIGDKKTIYNDDYYQMIKPIAEYRAKPFTEVRNVKVNGQTKQLVIEQYYPKRYETQEEKWSS